MSEIEPILATPRAEKSVQTSSSLDKAYGQITEQGVVLRQNRGVLSVKGADTLDFLQRMSTNDMDAIKGAGTACTTVLTNEKARIIDIVDIINPGDALLMLTSHDAQHKVKSWLEKFIIMEDITITDVTSDFCGYLVYGVEGLSRAGIADSIMLNPSSQQSYWRGSGAAWHAIKDTAWNIPVFYCLTTLNDQFSLMVDDDHLIGAAFEAIRIENGVPLAGTDFTDQTNPLEARMEKFISFSKGCYIGQEVIARLDTYKKLQRRLAGLIFDNDIAHPIRCGKLWNNGEEIGYSTSHTWSPKLRRNIALGYVKTEHEGGTAQLRSDQSSKMIGATIVQLPFDGMH